MNYIKSIVSLRGIASISVCIYHLALGNSKLFNTESLLAEISKYGYLGVEIFFIISGFVVPYSMMSNKFSFSKLGSFLLRRSLRVEIPYVFSIFLVLFLSVATSYFVNHNLDFSVFNFFNFFANIFYLSDLLNVPWLQPVYYTLKIEFQFYVLIGLLFSLFVSKKLIIQLLVFASLIALSFLEIIELLHYLPLFLIGIITFLYKVNKLNAYLYLLGLLILLAIILNQFYLAISLVSLFSVVYILYMNSGNMVMDFLGKISFSLYLVHIPIGGKIVNFGLRYVEAEYQHNLLFILALAASIGVSYVFFNLIENPALKLSKKIKYNE